ncbi:MAG: DUF3592 domain-containing protein [Pseudomonadota bacterium]
MEAVLALIGRPAATGLCLAAAALALAWPALTWRARGRWRRVEARVTVVAQRRSLAGTTWPVGIAYEADGPREAVVQVDLVRQPLSPGDRLAVLCDPAAPDRVAMTRWQGASTPLMTAGLLVMAALVLTRPL